MEPENKRVSGRVRVEPTRPEPDPKTRIFSGNLTWTRPENLKFSGYPTRIWPENPIFSGFLKIFSLNFFLLIQIKGSLDFYINTTFYLNK
jgi:hypothetical protein